VLDNSPERHHLTLIGARCVNAKYGRGLSLVGSATARTEEDAPNFTDRLTISAWVYPYRVSGTQDIVREGSTPSSYGLFIVEGNFIFSVAFPGEVTHHVFAPAPVRQWTHVTGVYDGTATTKSIKIYTDGQNRDEKPITDLPPLQQSTQPVVIGGHALRGRIDEVGLYEAVFTDDEVKNLAGQDKSVYFGSDSYVYPDGDRFSTDSTEEMGYNFYAGRLGRWLEGAPQGSQACRITNTSGHDVITGDPVPEDEKCAFIYEAALIARPERTYGFWWMAGPDHDDAHPFKRPGRNLSGFGRAQASEANSQWKTYNHLVGGRTLFADVERCISLPGEEPGERIPCTVENDTAGWAQCKPSESRVNACKDNQAVLEGFLSRVAALGFTPGVYTRPGIWNEFFGENYVPTDASGKPIPFVLWSTGLPYPATTDTENGGPRLPEKVEQDFRAAEVTGLGGMRTVIWQHHMNRPDWDAMRQNPSKGFVPQPEDGIFTITVKGSDAIFLAGRTDLVIPPASDPWPGGLMRHTSPTPEEIQETVPPFIPVSGGDVIRGADPAVGGVSFFNGFGGNVFGPSGNGLSGSNLSPFGGISGYIGPQGPLSGVFLDDSVPAAGPPATLDFSPAGLGINFLTLSPGLGQVFYIGDGITAGGAFQEFIAPVGATRLFLGIPDGFGFNGAPGAYDDNDGSYQIRIERSR
jgi:hypothetical protein